MFYNTLINIRYVCLSGSQKMKVISEEKVGLVRDFIKDFQQKEGRAPSFRQIAKGCNFPSIQTAQKYVAILQSRGEIEKTDSGKIAVPFNLQKGRTIIAPLVGSIACGPQILAVQNIEATYQLPTAIFGDEPTMILTAKGNSMTGVGIYDGDLIVASICNEAKNGDVVVALIDDSATVKTYYKKNGKHILHPENPEYEDILPENLIIQGIVKHTIHSF